MDHRRAPMSATQQGIFFDLQSSDPSDYHVVLHLRTDPIDPVRLRLAVEHVMTEQPALRSAVLHDKDGLAYRIHDSVVPPFSSLDHRGAGTVAIEDLATASAREPFDLGHAPLFRVAHHRMAEEDHLVIVCHHLVADGTSVSLLAERLLELVRLDEGVEPAERAVDNGFAWYQEERSQGPSFSKEAKNRAYWDESLSGQEAPNLAHWLGAARGPGRETRVRLNGELSEGLRDRARSAEVSEFTVFLSAFGLLLADYSAQDRVSVATPFADRPGMEMENSVGCFIKTLPLAIDLSGDPTVDELLRRTAGEVIGGWKHLDYSLGRLKPDHPRLDRILDVNFIHDRYPELPEGVRGRRTSSTAFFPGALTVLVEQIGETTELVVQYREDALTRDQADRFILRFRDVLAQFTGSEDRPVTEITATTPHEAAAVLEAAADTHHFDREPTSVARTFLDKTTAAPAEVAWMDEDRDYTNAWVHDMSVLVQRRLLEALGGQRRPVGILLPRGPRLLAAVFGTVISGSHYVPLSADMPVERLTHILSDAGVSAVITTTTANVGLPDDVRRLDLDSWPELVSLASQNPTVIGQDAAEVTVSPEEILYIEYTSGSTGTPKGVIIRHANVQNTALDLERRFPLGRDDVFLVKTSFTFDIFGTELYGWLYGAGRLAVLPVGQESDALATLRAIERWSVTHANFTPTLLRVVLTAAGSDPDLRHQLRSARFVFSGGEALPPDLVNRYFALGLPASLENVYGPTEATMWATHTTVLPEDARASVPIGKPLNDYRVYALGRQDRLCGVDLPGELCIVGAGVGAGYLNRDELNAVHFTDNPFFDPAIDPDHMQRMYRTGDLGYLRDDGRFAFVRRIDRQSKVGGVRIEPGEVEEALLRIPEVVSAAVVVDETLALPRLIAYFTSRVELSDELIHEELSRFLNPQMIPALLVRLDQMPMSSAGKLDRRALQSRSVRAASSRERSTTTLSSVEERILAQWRTTLGTDDINLGASFFDNGGNSLSLMTLQIGLKEEFGRDISVTDLLRCATVSTQARLLARVQEDGPASPPQGRPPQAAEEDIAIIGIGIQVPGATNVQTFWGNLRDGVGSITFYDDGELRGLGVSESDLADPRYVKAAGRLDGTETFDDQAFELAPAEVAMTSPQLRLLYECFWQACDDAGYDPTALPGRVGVFVGGSDDFAWYRQALQNRHSFGEAYQAFTLATNHFLGTRLSYQFDLTGPSLSALTGCSTSLMTVHLAVQSLRSGECELAVAGGVTLETPNDGGYTYAEGMMLSPDGHCRPFDAQAQGTVFSNGAALLLLKPLSAAMADGDPLYAVIKGSAVSNDGRKKQSYTAPSQEGQFAAISDAYQRAGLDPSTVSYVEAHGTGTPLGDPIEVASLTRAFAGLEPGSCVLGSVKGNIGHTDTAAGVVALAKVALSLRHRFIPGTRNFRSPNPGIDFSATPFAVTGEGQPWGGDHLRAGINSFGVGGTNVHMIIDEAPSQDHTTDESTAQELLVFSGSTEEAVGRTAERVMRHLTENPQVRPQDAAATLQSRTSLPCRKSVVVRADDDREAEAWTRRLAAARSTTAISGGRVAFVLSGQGNQHHAMGRDLYHGTGLAGTTFRHWMDRLIDLLPSAAESTEFREIVYGPEDDGRIHRTEWSQFALFATQFATVKVLETFGIRPDVLIGHSIGELTAAALADVWSLEDAVRLIRQRGRLMEQQAPGIMIAVAAPASRVRELVDGIRGVWVSLDNSHQRSVLGLRSDCIDTVLGLLEKHGIRGTRLQTQRAFHTPMMATAASAFAETVAAVENRDPALPIISNRSGETVRPGEMADARYWADHITGEVRFTEGLRTLLAPDGPLYGIELGPGWSLTTFASHDPEIRADQIFVNVLRHSAEETPDDAYLLGALGRLWGHGLEVEWAAHHKGRRVSLPGYAFAATEYPLPAPSPEPSVPAAGPSQRIPRLEASHPLNHERKVSASAGRGSSLSTGQGLCVDTVIQGFAHVLGHREIAPDQDFFELGGDSLKAAALAAHLCRIGPVQVSVSDLFAAPSPRRLSALLSAHLAAPALTQAPKAEDYPLSPAQMRMYMAAQLAPLELVYNMPSVTRLDGPVDASRIRQALERLVRRHEPLRTTFTVRDGQVRQRIAAAEEMQDLPLRFLDAQDSADLDADRALREFARPFDLARGPLFRMDVVGYGEERSLLLFDVHHIIADAVSVEVVTRDFSRLYHEELEPLELQYVDYVHHMSADSRRESVEVAVADVVEGLRGAPHGIDLLPLDRARGGRTVSADRVTTSFDAEQAAIIKRLAADHQATPFMVMVALWGAVLGRYGNQEDLVIGAPTSGRTLVATTDMVGMFVNLVPLRLRPEAQLSFADYLRASAAGTRAALERQAVPFERVVERLGVERRVNRHPLLDISIDYHNIEHHDLQIGNVRAHQVETEPLGIGMDLVVTCLESPDGLTVQVDYADELFDRSTIDELVARLRVLLDRVGAEANRALAAVPLHSDADHEAIRSSLHADGLVPIHCTIGEQAAESPEAVALIDGDGTVYTRARLEEMANAVAGVLLDAGLTPGDPVALYTVRNANLLVAQLGIIKAGGAYLPLDPTQPEARRREILADMRPTMGFVPQSHVEEMADATVFDVMTCTQLPASQTDLPEADLDGPIYAVYTSGSTGRPKGIMVRHRGAANLLQDHRDRGLFDPRDVIISLADPTFDIFLFESLIPLALGATVHICPESDRHDASAVAQRISTHGVTHLQVPVSKMSAFYGNRRMRAELARLKVIACGGEHFPENLVSLLQAHTGARIFNMYGPTETTVTATVKEFTGTDTTVTIGTAVSGSAVLVADERGMICPDGVSGEICIAGQGLSRGYTNNPEGQQQSFTTLLELPGVVVYRTGDAGRRLSNGEFVLTGRLDHQVKVNGNRIELGEVEKTAMSLGGIAFAVASVADDVLVLHYTSNDGVDKDDQIYAECERRLPVYMRPTRLLRREQWPHLPNGKVDRNALDTVLDLSVDAGRDSAAAGPNRAAGPLQAGGPTLGDALTAIKAAWEEVLGHAVKDRDNFFDVGGTSYKFMLVNNRISELLDVELPLVTLFEHPTPAGLATVVAPAGETLQAQAASQPALAPQDNMDEDLIGMDLLGDFADWPSEKETERNHRIAVIGMALEFPGASTAEQFWRNRRQGVVSIDRLSRNELLASGVDAAEIGDPRYVNARGVVDADTFDAEFFSYSVKQAETMDPQMRLLHETVWHALEDGGYASDSRDSNVALYVGSGTNFAWLAGLLGRGTDELSAFETMTMNEKDFLASKVSYRLNLTGPAVTVQTACSTSLVAIHEAVQCLRRGQAEMALAGGVALNFPRREGYTWHEGMIFSQDGVCRPFSDDADGTVGGQGCGVVLLKPLDAAIADGDHVYAVVSGSATNNDGNDKAGYTAPSVRGQSAVIKAALDDAGLTGAEIGYVETHGTGTSLGDPIEYRALSQHYGRGRSCALGATKANIGHLDAAAGVAGFISAVGVLHQRQVPPMANWSTLNRAVDPSRGVTIPEFAVPLTDDVRQVAVSSFGIGGTNAHLILEDAPVRAQDRPDDDGGWHLMPVSARTGHALKQLQDDLEDVLSGGQHCPADISFSLAHGRAEFGSRAVGLSNLSEGMRWVTSVDIPDVFDAADSAILTVADDLWTDDSLLGREFQEVLTEELSIFEESMRTALRDTLASLLSAEPAMLRVAQFVMRVVLLRMLGTDSLGAASGRDRLLRIARSRATGQISAREAVQGLRTVAVPPGSADHGGPVPTLADTPIDAVLLGRVLASRWVHGDPIDRRRFASEGRRVPLPVYPFERRSFTADIDLRTLRGGLAVNEATAADGPEEQGGLTDDLRAAWRAVLGDVPAEDSDFLTSGGDSLTAVRFCSLVQDQTGVSLSVADVFADPTFGGLRARALGLSVQLGHQPGPVDVPADPSKDRTSGESAEGPTLQGGSAAAPLSNPTAPAQRRMYAVCAMERASTAYNLAVTYRARGRLDLDRLRAAFRVLVDRHEQLRTSFHLVGGDLLQTVHPTVDDVVHHRRVSQEEADALLAAGPAPFDLEVAPLFRVEVLTVADDLNYLSVDMHHIIGDQQSLAVLTEELTMLLDGRRLPEAPTAYAAFVDASLKAAASGLHDRDVEYFTQRLSGEVPALELPASTSPGHGPDAAGRRFTLDSAVALEDVAALAARSGATPYMVFLAAITRVLGLHGGQQEFVIGTAVSGRTMTGLERTVGMFVNTLPVAVGYRTEHTVEQAVAASRQQILEVLRHQEAPLEAILQGLGVQTGDTVNPLFDVLFNFVAEGTEDLTVDGINLEPMPAGDVQSRYAISLSVAQGVSGYSVDIEYRTDQFSEATVEMIAFHLDHLLLSMVSAGDQRFGDLPMEDSETHRRRRAALTAEGPAIIEETLLDRLQVSFHEHAEATALCWQEQKWTYADLDHVTNQLAGGLQQAGVKPGDRVVCVLERDPWQVFARLALMKCGAIEVPVDPSAPAQRIAHVLNEADPVVVLATDPTARAWPDSVQVHHPWDLRGKLEHPADATPDSTLIMIYTSGTTGMPKGTLVTQRGVLSTCADNGYMDYGPGDRVAFLTGYTFDPSLLDVYSALLSGATLVMGSHEVNLDTRELARFVTGQRVNKGILITAVFHMLMAEDPHAIAHMDAIYVGGEAMQAWAACQAFDVLGPGRLFNLYGPTEASVCTTYHRVDEMPREGRVPIGRPAANRELFILHPDGTDVPRGVRGELCVAGPSLATGYHQRDALTAEKFVEPAVAHRPRIYRTGDRVMLDEQDRIVYLGRIDRQIKHAGHRIELSEIELGLQKCTGVSDAVVIHAQDELDSRLTGFYIGSEGTTEQSVHRQLVESLPAHMVPQRLVRTTEFPLTRHGKVDRKTLAEQAIEPAAAEPASSGPSGRISIPATVVLEAFREILKVRDLTPEDDFFAAGAQSLQAIGAVRQLRERGLDVQVTDIYRHPTAQSLAERLSTAPGSAAPGSSPQGRSTVRPEQLGLMARRAVDDTVELARGFSAAAPEYHVRLSATARLHRQGGASTGGFVQRVHDRSAAEVRGILAQLIHRHETLRARMDTEWFDILGLDEFAGVSNLLTIHDLRGLNREQIREFVDSAAARLWDQPFNQGLLWRCVILQESDDAFTLVWAFHHSIFDGISAGIIRAEFTRLTGSDDDPVPPYSQFLSELVPQPDWDRELAGFDYPAWLQSSALAARKLASGGNEGNLLTGRISLDGDNPLDKALQTVHRQLAEITGTPGVAVAVVQDCRQWKGVDYTSSLGEFLDAVPVFLSGEEDTTGVSQRLRQAREQGLHYIHALTHWSGQDAMIMQLRQAFGSDTGRLAFPLVNFQGYISPEDIPQSMPDEEPLAGAQVNIWYDDEHLHLQLLVASAQSAGMEARVES